MASRRGVVKLEEVLSAAWVAGLYSVLQMPSRPDGLVYVVALAQRTISSTSFGEECVLVKKARDPKKGFWKELNPCSSMQHFTNISRPPIDDFAEDLSDFADGGGRLAGGDSALPGLAWWRSIKRRNCGNQPPVSLARAAGATGEACELMVVIVHA